MHRAGFVPSLLGRGEGPPRRSVTLPEGTRPEQIQAAFDDGLVEIVIAGAVKRADSTRIELRYRSTGATRRSLG